MAWLCQLSTFGKCIFTFLDDLCRFLQFSTPDPMQVGFCNHITIVKGWKSNKSAVSTHSMCGKDESYWLNQDRIKQEGKLVQTFLNI